MKKKPQQSAQTGPEPVSVDQALKQRREDLTIKDKGEVLVGPEGEYARFFQRVRVSSFKDLQRMSFVPEGLDEKKAMDAIARDNDAAFEAALRAPDEGDPDCGCDCDGRHDAETPASRPAGRAAISPLRARYSRLRRNFHPQLARALTEVYRRDVQWDHMVATHVHRWIDRLVVAKEFDLGSILFRDIVVGKNSTFNVAASTQILWANDIRIHVGGKIRTLGSYMKVKCASIQGNLA
ncbi:hypothetical protein QFW77_11365 [Luteimonas sp. RD2P54]|uniref:DUF342 domain-containing protein n=1 Tax=Luteimonas endophytica TaxID=3042023 RepID=A0ABT6J9S5_9GAMM|nr:hypothetical protein [Luteimonas endophytica]MDH5823585.1 hypothetical protein [Luteimonas endophytica]